MDPSSLAKFLEEDKYETMHSGADVDALTAALKRDMDGNKSISQPSYSDNAHRSQVRNYCSNHSVSHWNNSSQNESTNQQLQQDMNRCQQQEPHWSAVVGHRLQNPLIQSQNVQNQVTKSQYPMPTHNPENEGRNSQAGSSQPPQLSSQIYQKIFMSQADVSHLNPSSASQLKANSSNAMDESNSQGFQDMETETDLYGKRSSQINIKQERKHVHFPQKDISIYGSPGGNNHRSLSGPNINSLAASSSLKQQGLDTHMRQGLGHQSVREAQLGASTQSMNSFMEAKRKNSESSSGSTIYPSPLPRSITAQVITHWISSEGPGNYAKILPKRPPTGQKKPHDSLVSTPPQPSKKQKVSGSLEDQSIEELNDVTAVSGVNLREEEEQLFSGSKEDSLVSEVSLRVVKEEEERLILQKTPLRNKLAEIMSKYGVKNMNGDVERCLSLSVEERMRVLISSLIRLSKQRVDIEKSMHRTLVTSDIRKQIMEINQKAREEWDPKQSEAEKLQKPNEPEGGDGVDCNKEKEDGRAKSLKQKKVNKEEDDKMRTTAANDAARAAVGGDDMFSKWQLMAEQARQKCKDISLNTSPSIAKASEDSQAALIFGSSRKSVRSQMLPQTEVACSISVEDVIAVLEREPQMSKSEILYRLYEKCNTDIDA